MSGDNIIPLFPKAEQERKLDRSEMNEHTYVIYFIEALYPDFAVDDTDQNPPCIKEALYKIDPYVHIKKEFNSKPFQIVRFSSPYFNREQYAYVGHNQGTPVCHVLDRKLIMPIARQHMSAKIFQDWFWENKILGEIPSWIK